MRSTRSTIPVFIILASLASSGVAVEEQVATPFEEVGCCEASDCCCARDCCASGIETGGWISSGIYANQYGAKDNGPLTLRDYGNGYTVDQIWLYAEKKANNRGYGLAAGGRVDFVWGADGPDVQCHNGWDSRWITSDDGNYGSAMPQLYGEVAYNDLSVKVGQFYTIIGYETVAAPNNFFYSHSYAMATEPFTHMGALGKYAWNDRVTLHGGWTNGGRNGWLNPSGASMFLGGASLRLRKDLSLTYATIFGDLINHDSWGSRTKGTGYQQSLVFDWKLSRRWNYVLQSDFMTLKNTFNGGVFSEVGKLYGISQYLRYAINDRWAAGARVEWFRTEARQVALSLPGDSANTMTGVTLGLNYTPNDRIVLRPEIRWDAGSSRLPFFAQRFDDDTRSSQFSGGFDCIVKF